jgi:hypothetical protein
MNGGKQMKRAKRMQWQWAVIVLTTSLLATASTTSVARAQEPSTDPKRALIHELVDVMQADQTSLKVADAFLKQLEAQYPKMLSDLASERSDLTPEQRDRVKQASARSFTRFVEIFKTKLGNVYASDEFFEKVYYPVYSKYYTESELKDLIVFYRSPTGQKVLHVLPEFTGDVLKSTFDVLGPKLQEIVHETLKEELERLKEEKTEAA